MHSYCTQWTAEGEQYAGKFLTYDHETEHRPAVDNFSCLLFVTHRIVGRFIWPTHAACHLVRREFSRHRAPTATKTTAAGLKEPRYGTAGPQQRPRGPGAVQTAVGCPRCRCRCRMPSPTPYSSTNFRSFRLTLSPSSVAERSTTMEAR